MRTTLSIDDDILAAVKERARHEKRAAGDVASDLIRRALAEPRLAAGQDFVVRNGFVALASRGGIVTNELVNRIRAEEGI